MPLKFDLQTVWRALSLALRRAGVKTAISKAMMAITTKISISVKLLRLLIIDTLYFRSDLKPKGTKVCGL